MGTGFFVYRTRRIQYIWSEKITMRSPYRLTGFNQDVVAEGTDSNPLAVTSTGFDGSTATASIFYDVQFQLANSGVITSSGLPNNGSLLPSAEQRAPGTNIQIRETITHGQNHPVFRRLFIPPLPRTAQLLPNARPDTAGPRLDQRKSKHLVRHKGMAPRR